MPANSGGAGNGRNSGGPLLLTRFWRPAESQVAGSRIEQIAAKLHDFADKDLLQHIDLARFLFGKAIPPCREAR
jgi:hypothetical protein